MIGCYVMISFGIDIVKQSIESDDDLENPDTERYHRLALMSSLQMKRDLTYMQHVECEICEWTDNINIQDELWSRHTALLAFSHSL